MGRAAVEDGVTFRGQRPRATLEDCRSVCPARGLWWKDRSGGGAGSGVAGRTAWIVLRRRRRSCRPAEARAPHGGVPVLWCSGVSSRRATGALQMSVSLLNKGKGSDRAGGCGDAVGRKGGIGGWRRRRGQRRSSQVTVASGHVRGPDGAMELAA